MSLLRLPTLDRPSLGFSRRFSLLSTNTAPSSQDDLTSSLASLRTLPSVEHLDNDDFLRMFEGVDERALEPVIRPQEAVPGRSSASELSATPITRRFPELHGTPIQRFELGSNSATPRRTPVLTKEPVIMEQPSIAYRSSISSSVPSTKLSNASSRPSRRSSMSSMTEVSSEEPSSKDSDKETALHERLKRRSREKRASLGNRSGAFKARSESYLPRPEPSEPPPRIPQTPTSPSSPKRPASRGERLGRAIASPIPISPPPTPRIRSDQSQRQIKSERRVSNISNTSAPRKTSAAAAQIKGSSRIVIPAVDEVDRIRVGIMSQLDDLNDLQSCAQVSKDFYLTFLKYETTLVECVLHHQSPAAWELRHSVRHLEKPSPFRLRSIQRDYTTIQALEDFIIGSCHAMLRRESLDAFLGDAPQRKIELEEAIWTVWSFCNAFGKTSMSDGTLLKQTQWLNGGQRKTSGESNPTRPSCTMKELEDISEIWRCLESLLSGFKGREEEARQAGIFDNVRDSKSTDRELLNAWIYDILSLGPKAVLTLSSCDFEHAKVLGITRWSPPAKGRSRSNFLKAAVEEVYRERLMKQARQKATDYRKSVQGGQHHHKRSWSDPAHAPIHVAPKLRTRASQRVLKVSTRQASRQSMPPPSLTTQPESFELRPDCDPLSPVQSTPVLSASTNPTIFSPLSMTQNVSTRLGATLFPIQNRDQSHRHSVPMNPASSTQRPSSSYSNADVIDPTDKAVALMVQEMGFSEADAKRALAMSDTGSGINVEKAIDFLASKSHQYAPARRSQICELPALVGEAPLTGKADKREVCEGNCKPIMLVGSRRDRVSGLGMVKRGFSYRMSFRKSNRLSVIPDDEEVSQQNSPTRSAASSSNGGNRDSPMSHLASSALPISSITLLTQAMNAREQKSTLVSVAERSPVSPVTPTAPEWLKPDTNPTAGAQNYLENATPYSAIPAKPRITLQRVGTGTKKTGWSMPGRKRREQVMQPEIIGYTC